MKLLYSLLFLVVVSLSACGATGTDAVRKSVDAAALALKTVPSALDPVDQAKVDAALAKAQAGDLAGAQADLNKWAKQNSDIRKGLDAAWDALRVVEDGCDAVDKGNKTKNVPQLVTQLAAVLAQLASNLAAAGITVPAGL